MEVDGFYRRHLEGRWDFATWNAVMDSAIHDRTKERGFILSAGFTEVEFDFMIDMIKRYRDEFPCRQPVLNHGDYLPGHIFVDEALRITGVIDFGMYEGAPPAHDFAYMNGRIELAPVIEGYGDQSSINGSFQVRMRLHQVALGMGHVAHNMMIGNTPSAELSAQRLRHAMTGLRNL